MQFSGRACALLLTLLGLGLVSTRVMFPNYAIMVALACVGGACSFEEETPPITTTSTTTTFSASISNFTSAKCQCPVTLNLAVDGVSSQKSICNNATFDWLLHTLLTQIAVEKEQVANKATYIANMRQHNFNSEDEIHFLREEKNTLSQENAKLQDQNEHLLDELDALRRKTAKELVKPMDCGDIQRFGFHYSGFYMIYPRGLEQGLSVFCDLNIDGGGWTLIQRRQDGSQSFARDWAEYKGGFGSASKEFWMGNDNIAAITQQRQYEMRVDMTDYKGVSGHAFYKSFDIEGENTNYKLHIKGYSGDAGDAMSQHNMFQFTTQDRDNDCSNSGQCSQLFGNGGWWYGKCYDSNLNGIYGRDEDNKGIVWFQWMDDFTPQREVEMKIRPVGF